MDQDLWDCDVVIPSIRVSRRQPGPPEKVTLVVGSASRTGAYDGRDVRDEKVHSAFLARFLLHSLRAHQTQLYITPAQT